MSDDNVESEPLIDVEPMSVDQLAGAFVMIAGAITITEPEPEPEP
jgi:hypothetical protein